MRAVAVLIGLPALRIPGLYLAVTTLAFAVFVSVWLVAQGTFLDASGLLPDARSKPDAGHRRLLVAPLLLLPVPRASSSCASRCVAQLRRTGIGRSVIAVRDNERVGGGDDDLDDRAKLLAFAVSGGMAALAGCSARHVAAHQHAGGDVRAQESVKLVAIVVIGGLGSIVGPVLGAAWVIGLPPSSPTRRSRRSSCRASACSGCSCSSPAASSRSHTASATHLGRPCRVHGSLRAHAAARRRTSIPVPAVLGAR